MALDEKIPSMAGMLASGFDVNTANDAHETAFIHCCANDRLLAARFLVSRGADVNLADHGGTTGLDFARRHASRDFCNWLARVGGRARDSGDYAHRPAGERRS